MRTDKFNETEDGYSVCAVAVIDAADSLKAAVMEDCMAVGQVCALCRHRLDVIRSWYVKKSQQVCATSHERCENC